MAAYVSPISISHGPALAGVFFNVMLFGVIISQGWDYYIKYKKDPLWIKTYVSVLILADFLNSLFVTWWIFDLVIMNFGNLLPFAFANWQLASDPAMGGVIAVYCQSFYAWRLYVLTGNKLVSGSIIFLGFCVLTGGVGAAIALHFKPSLADFQTLAPLVYVWLVPAVLSDLIITAAMTHFLRKRRTGFSKTEDVLKKIVRMTVQSCLLTTLFSIADLASYLATPEPYHIAISMFIPKLYTNSVLSSLNSRPRKGTTNQWETQADNESHSLSNVESQQTGSRHLNMQIMSAKDNARNQARSRAVGQSGGTAVFVDVETHVADDSKHVHLTEDEDSITAMDRK